MAKFRIVLSKEMTINAILNLREHRNEYYRNIVREIESNSENKEQFISEFRVRLRNIEKTIAKYERELLVNYNEVI